MAVYRKALFRDRNQTIKRTLFTLQRRPDALRGVFQALNRREFTLNTLNCPICVLSNRTILTLSCRHPTFALEKYQPGQFEPILVGAKNLLKPALRLMTWYRLVIEEVQDAQVTTSYTRWVDAALSLAQICANR